LITTRNYVGISAAFFCDCAHH